MIHFKLSSRSSFSQDVERSLGKKHRPLFRPTALALALAGAVAVPGMAIANDWTGAVSNDWSTNGNWVGGAPDAVTDVNIDTMASNPAFVTGAAAAQAVTVGNQGVGVLSISGAGMLQSGIGSTDAHIGLGAGADGTVTVTGPGASWINTNGALIVGEGGKGSLAILDGGVVSGGPGVIGLNIGSFGAVNVSGFNSSWTNQSSLIIGEAGSGTLTIGDGGSVANAGLGLIGRDSGSIGSVTVDGVDTNGVASKWNNNLGLTVGASGTGTLVISNGGQVSTGAGGGSTGVNIGFSATGKGTVTVTGPGSSWINGGNDMIVGTSGQGSMVIANGGKVSNGAASIGFHAGSSGSVDVSGSNSTWIWTNSSSLVIGDAGSGTLAIGDGGAVIITGLGLIGRVAGSAGSVTVDGIDVNGVASKWDAGNLTVGGSGSGALTLSNGGVVAVGGDVNVAIAAVSTGTLNIGGQAGFPALAPGQLNAVNLLFGAGAGTLNFNHNSAGYVFDPAISGKGTINQNAGITTLTGNSSGFTGVTNVNGGRLAVNGSLGSLVTVNSGGILGGSGTVGAIQANSGGIVAPGNSIGTLQVAGNLGQAAGSVYVVELDAAGQSDLIHVAGSATIENGALLRPVRLGAAPLVVGTHYIVLQADSGVSGRYLLRNPFLIFTDSYDATHAYLDLTQVKSFAEVGLTANQKAAGAAAESLGSGNLVYEAVLMSPTDAAAQAAFDQLSGEVHASARSVLLQDSHFARDASLERLRAMDSESVANDGGADATEGKPARLLSSLRDLAYWGRAMGSWGRVNGDGNAATVKRDTSGFLMGADTRFGEEGRFGVMGGYSRSAFDAVDRNSSGSSDNYHLGVYGGSRWGDLALRTGITYSWHDVSASRVVAFPGFNDSLKAGYKANTTQAFAELGYRIRTEQAELEPFANLAHVKVSSEGFTERGGAAALSGSGSGSGVTFSTLGLRASTKVPMTGGADLTARGSLGWRHAFGDTAPTTSLAFAGGAPFMIAGIPVARSAAVIEAGLDFKLTNMATLGVSYGGQFGSGLKDHSARVHLNVAF